ncbi:MAG TPA: hypothetical protein VFW87_00915 [Pirellulales bacterium]|nr:hypothetical protein [Pirellulales bacterium]
MGIIEMRPSFSLRGLLFAIVIVAIACAAVAYPSRSWASGLFSAVLLLVVLATLGSAASRGAARAGLGGFAWLGGAYLMCAFGPWFDRQVAPHLPLTRLIPIWDDQLKESIKPTNAGAVSMALEGSRDGASIWAVTQADGASYHVQVFRPTRELLARIVHSLSGFVLAMLGALAGRWFYFAADRADRGRQKSGAVQ